jgi:hypothetical protein
MENQVAQCEALLKRHIPGFELDKLEEFLLREGLEIPVVNPQVASSTSGFQFQQPPPNSGYRGGPGAGPQSPPQQPPGMYYPPPPNMMGPPPPGYMMPPYGPHFHPMQMQPPPGYNPHIHPSFQQPPPGYPTTPHMAQVQPQSQAQSQSKPQARRPDSSKGLDPNGNDMSNTEVQYTRSSQNSPPNNFINRRSPKTLVSHPSSWAISALVPPIGKISPSDPTGFPLGGIATFPHPEMPPNG